MDIASQQNAVSDQTVFRISAKLHDDSLQRVKNNVVNFSKFGNKIDFQLFFHIIFSTLPLSLVIDRKNNVFVFVNLIFYTQIKHLDNLIIIVQWLLNIISDILLRTNNSSYLLLGFFGFLGFTQTDGVIHRNEFIMDGVQDA